MIFLSSASFSHIPPPVPPIVNAGRTTTGYPHSFAKPTALSTLFAMILGGTGSFSSYIKARKSSLSSALFIVSRLEPKIFTLYLSKTPALCSLTAKFSAT